MTFPQPLPVVSREEEERREGMELRRCAEEDEEWITYKPSKGARRLRSVRRRSGSGQVPRRGDEHEVSS